MIKVIASDMDGTLLNEEHTISPETIQTIHRAQEKGIRFVIVTGRDYISAMQELDKTDLVCDYILSSGAQVRDEQKQLKIKIDIDPSLCRRTYLMLEDFPVTVMFCTEGKNYMIGTPEEIEQGILKYIWYFYPDLPIEEVRDTVFYRQMWEKTNIVPDYEALEASQVSIEKIFVVSADIEALGRIKNILERTNELAVSSSLDINLEITDVRAQKGPILKQYIESLGYTMDEVMVFGDSLNDYSMLSMDFGATVAMENAEPEIKRVAKYVTRSNAEDGVAYTIEKMLTIQSHANFPGDGNHACMNDRIPENLYGEKHT